MSLAAVKRRFGRASAQRQKSMRGLEAAVENLRATGVRRVWIDGSFVTRKQAPNDVDGCWEYSDEVDLEVLDPVFLLESRRPMKAKYGIEFFPAFAVEADSGLPFPAFFQVNRDGEPKGILAIAWQG
jgi:uncharacterized protein DUF6932